MIPKIIHYFWVGGTSMPPEDVRCIESWKKYCPDYEIREWNESNYDFGKIKYMQDAYNCGKWAFVPDYARLDVVYQYGGFYFDTDVEIIRPIDELRDLSGFVGMENPGMVNMGAGFGAEAGNETIKALRDDYINQEFINDIEYLRNHASPVIQTKVLRNMGLHTLNKRFDFDDFVVFPVEYFSPLSMDTMKTTITEDTYSIHYFDGSWLDDVSRQGRILRRELYQKYGIVLGGILYKIRFSFFLIGHYGVRAWVHRWKSSMSYRHRKKHSDCSTKNSN